MTPKQKAIDLVVNIQSDSRYEIIPINISKIIASKFVDEILELYLNIGQHQEDDEDKVNYYSYWEEVKKEIEKL